MTLLQFFRIFNRNLNLFLLCAILMAAVVYFFTRNLPREYEAETEIYTGIASGVSAQNLGDSKVDYNTANTDYDNLINIIKSKHTLEEVGNRLLVQHMMLDTLDENVLSRESYRQFRQHISPSLEKELLVPYSVELTLRKLRKYKKENFKDPNVKWLFESQGSPYSYKTIGSLSVNRVQNSDLLRIKYTYRDPGITQNTLLIINEVFTKNMARIKLGQSDDVVDYFREQVNLALERLDDAESRLQEFRVENRMINYQEQTRSLAMKKEAMEDEYQKELAMNRAAKAAVERLESQLALNNNLLELGETILDKKKDLIDLRAKIAELETYYNDQDLLRKLHQKADKLQEEISNRVLARYEQSRTTDGIGVESIINEWLNYTLKLEETQARLDVYQERRDYFEKAYDEYSALGAKAARLEREISIAENNYLEVLSRLNQAKLRQRSQKISSGGLTVTVPPDFPLEPNKSKSMLLVLVAAVVGFVVPFAVILLREFLDSSIRTPGRAESLTKLKLLGAYPDLTQRGESKDVDFNWLHQKASGLLAQNLRLEARQAGISDQKPKFLTVFSTREGDGKLLTTHVLANELASHNMRVMVLSHKDLEPGETPYYDFLRYNNDKRFVNSENLTEIVPMGYDPALYDYVILILEAVLTNPYPIHILDQSDLLLCVVGAYRDWNRADRSALADFKSTLHPKPRLLLNGVEPDFMQSVLGDIEKRRSWIRRMIKRIVTLQLRRPTLKNSLN